MKKIIIAFVLLACSAVFAKAQKLTFALEGSFGKGTQFISMEGGASFIAGYKVNNALELGLGAGARYSQALYAHETYKFTKLSGESKTSENNYDNDQILVPVFVRAKYVLDGVNLSTVGRLSPFFAIDGGYAVNVHSTQPECGFSKAVVEASKGRNLEGFFYIPQIGFDSDRIYVAVGLSVQAVKQVEVITNVVETRNYNYKEGVWETYENIGQDYNIFNNFAQAISFKVGFKF